MDVAATVGLEAAAVIAIVVGPVDVVADPMMVVAACPGGTCRPVVDHSIVPKPPIRRHRPRPVLTPPDRLVEFVVVNAVDAPPPPAFLGTHVAPTCTRAYSR